MSRIDDLLYTLELILEDMGKRRMENMTKTGWLCIMEYYKDKDKRQVTERRIG